MKNVFFNCPIEYIKISTNSLFFNNQCFNFMGKILSKRNVYLITDSLDMGDNIFNGNYNNFNLNLISDTYNKIFSINAKIDSLNSINCSIENFNFNIYNNYNKIDINSFKNIGLTQEQFNKINLIS